MNQALYAHMNNKRKRKKKIKECLAELGLARAPVLLSYFAWQGSFHNPTAPVCGAVSVCVHEHKSKSKIIFKAVSFALLQMLLPTAFSFPPEERKAASD
jgi:hypothetical protein